MTPEETAARRRQSALEYALVYHRDVNRWGRLGRTTTDAEDAALNEESVIETARVFEGYLGGAS
jgi:hypothetical protein